MPELEITGYIELCGNRVCPYCHRLHLRMTELVQQWIPQAHGFEPCLSISLDRSRQPGRIFCGGMSIVTLNGAKCYAPTGTYKDVIYNPPHALVETKEYARSLPTDVQLPSHGRALPLRLSGRITLCENWFCNCCSDSPVAFGNFFFRSTYAALGLSPPVLPFYTVCETKLGWNFHRCGGHVSFQINGYKECFYLGKHFPDLFKVQLRPNVPVLGNTGFRTYGLWD